MPLIALAIAALPAVALLLAVVARMESTFFDGGTRDGGLDAGGAITGEGR